MHTKEDGELMHVPGGLVHHWAAVIFIAKPSIYDTLAVLEDYDHHYEIYAPDVLQSRLIETDGRNSQIYLQLFNKSHVTVVLNVNFDVTDTDLGSGCFEITARSTRIAEVANFRHSDEHEMPVGNDHGYLWRLYSYWRIEAKDGGVYVQNESIALTRTVPFMLAWLVNPLIKSIPRNFLRDLLIDTRAAVSKRN